MVGGMEGGWREGGGREEREGGCGGGEKREGGKKAFVGYKRCIKKLLLKRAKFHVLYEFLNGCQG